jgi:hypothetical protein
LETAVAQEQVDKLHEWLERAHATAEHWQAEAAKAAKAAKARLAQPPAGSAAPPAQPARVAGGQVRDGGAALCADGADEDWLVARVVELTKGCRRLEEAWEEGEARLDDALAVVEEQLGELGAQQAEIEGLRARERRLLERVAELEGAAQQQQPVLSAPMSKHKRRKMMRDRRS